LYHFLEEYYGITPKEIGDNFNIFHEIIKQLFGVNHYKIERLMIKVLHAKTASGTYSHSSEIAAFTSISNVFMEDIKEKIERNRELADSKLYAKHLEDKVRAYDDRLKSAERMVAIGQTAAMVGHDIRNPLQAIVGDLYLLDCDIAFLPEGENKKCMQESIRGIQANLEYIEKIVEDLQDYAKPLNPCMARVDFRKVIEDVLLIVPVPSNLDVSIDIDGNFPELITDFLMLKRALSNLVNNAVQAMPNGGKLTIDAYKDEEDIVVSVEDTGVGIPEQVKSKLFTPMFTTKAKGQGLGLAVVKRLVTALHGT
jgi:signal transduction histidine kinase